MSACVLRDRFDKDYHDQQDLCGLEGFFLALRMLLQVVPGGLFWGGVPCSSWIFLNMGTSGRKAGAATGDVSQPTVRIANLIASRYALLTMVALARSVVWCAEQPSSSLLPNYDRLRAVLNQMHQHHIFFSCRFSMGLYGASSLKPTKCFGSAWVPQNAVPKLCCTL